MRGTQRTLFLLAVALQVAVLAAMAGKRWWLLEHGTPVLLPCEPVDPRSLFSGDYVRLRLSLSSLGERSELSRLTNREWNAHEPIFVSVEKGTNAGLWRAVGVSADAPAARRRSPVFLKGEVQSGWPLSVRYGAEEYFVPQNEGLAIERSIRDREVTVELRVSASGESAIKRLFIQGKEVRFR
ncbi:MAG: GDYXXLXY domain-containing protein [Spirochaetes bacterium]|nr:GDYXXLXY domain-containing protein [Spirochaetota bacterium]